MYCTVQNTTVQQSKDTDRSANLYTCAYVQYEYGHPHIPQPGERINHAGNYQSHPSLMNFSPFFAAYLDISIPRPCPGIIYDSRRVCRFNWAPSPPPSPPPHV